MHGTLLCGQSLAFGFTSSPEQRHLDALLEEKRLFFETISLRKSFCGCIVKQSDTQDNGELRFIHKYTRKHVAHVTGTIGLAQTDRNSLVITVTALLETQTVSKSLMMTATVLSIALRSPVFQHRIRNSKVVPVDQQHYRDPSAVFYALLDPP
ncbi:hypothetical protein AVEN_185829-1 [Araneus ventricosus]|uniref:Uncharacterized protein n=1 Tax=Araneus ventricosus TaxID=182803 RepID=A0A4Y2I463_ARAVE|nr:hypothetical protein AVEN_185829-1 [Araneus ventricosus]